MELGHAVLAFHSESCVLCVATFRNKKNAEIRRHGVKTNVNYRDHFSTRTTIRVGGPDQVSSVEEHHGRHANGTRLIDVLGQTGTPFAEPDMRRGPILQSGQNVQSGHQENHTEHRVATETSARSRSTRSN